MNWSPALFAITLVFFATRAHGQVSFSQPPTYANSTYTKPGQIFVADFNGDGKPDILAGDKLDNVGTLDLGNGGGTFKSGTAVTGTPLAVADFNGDGKPDVLEQATSALLVLLGNGNGTFQAPLSTNSNASLTAVAATDLNGDGKADVVGTFNTTLDVYLANGDGTFAAAVPYSLGAVQINSALIAFGDFNGDHKTDVAVLYGTQEIVLLGNGDGTFQSLPLASTAAPYNGSAVLVGDFNGDGKLDLVTFAGGGFGQLEVSVFLQLGNGDGTFQAPTTALTVPVSGAGALVALAAGDVNGDGKLDLVVAADLIGIYLGNGNGTFASPPTYYQPMASGISPGIAIADFNSDTKPDVAVDGEVLLGKGNGTFQGPPTVLLPGSPPLVIAVAGKFVTNGAPGVAAIAANPGTSLYILTNDGTGVLSLAHTYTLPQPNYVIASGDLNGDGNLDLVVGSADPVSQNWSYVVLLGNGNGGFQTPVLHQQTVNVTNLSSLVIADFNNDHKLDLAVAEGNSEFALLLGNGDGTFGSPAYVFDGDGGPIVSGDFNGDGNLDMAEAGPSGLAILLGNGDGSFKPIAFPYTSSLSAVLAGDLNGDGKVDLISGTGAEIQAFVSNGDGTFDAPAPISSTGMGVALGDLNGDGKLDVVTTGYSAGSEAATSIYLGNGDGTFDPSAIDVPYRYSPHSVLPSVQIADMNGDGKPDLIIESPISSAFVLLNSTQPIPPHAPDFTIAAAPGSPRSQTIAAGQNATFNLTIGAVAGFTGSVILSCSISPAVNPPAACELSASSVHVGSTAQTVSVAVSTTGSTASRLPPIGLPPALPPLAWLAITLASGWLSLRRKRLATVVAPLLVVFVSLVGCGGGGPPSHKMGTPSGTYSATITATSGSLSHNMTLTVVVQ